MASIKKLCGLFKRAAQFVVNQPLLVPVCVLTMIGVYVMSPDDTLLFTVPFRLYGALIYILGSKSAMEAKKETCRIEMTVPSTPSPKVHDDSYFNYSRHPIYLAGCVTLVGVAVMLPTYYNFLIPVLYVVIIDCFVISTEESKRKSLYDKEYVAYQSRVGRWIGRRHLVDCIGDSAPLVSTT